jgi:BirA family biotin operon repressor/biotin-[acetyl-CoA-carboxylase] ligase
MTFGEPLRHFETIDSTNTEALRWIKENPSAPEGAVVVAEHQSAGRGRWGREWLSEPGRSLMFTVVLRPRFGVERSGLLTIAAGVACAEGLARRTGLPMSLKWPNDVMVEGRKVAGILAESQLSGSALETAVVGMGINFEWPSDDLPEEIVARATSLSLATAAADGPLPGRDEVLRSILQEFEMLYGLIGDAEGERMILERATQRSELIGRNIEVRYPDDRILYGVARGIRPSGQLEVESDGETVVVDVAEVQRVRPQ